MTKLMYTGTKSKANMYIIVFYIDVICNSILSPPMKEYAAKYSNRAFITLKPSNNGLITQFSDTQ